MDQDATAHPPRDPRDGFLVEGVRYRLEADPDRPRLWRTQANGSEIAVDVFGPSWDPFAVWLAAVDDLGRMKAAERAHEAGDGS